MHDYGRVFLTPFNSKTQKEMAFLLPIARDPKLGKKIEEEWVLVTRDEEDEDDEEDVLAPLLVSKAPAIPP